MPSIRQIQNRTRVRYGPNFKQMVSIFNIPINISLSLKIQCLRNMHIYFPKINVNTPSVGKLNIKCIIHHIKTGQC